MDPFVAGRNDCPDLHREVRRSYFGLLLADQLRVGEARIAATREAVGPDVDIICELHPFLGTNAANLYDATVQIHVCGGPVSTAASLQVEAAIPNFIIHEHHTMALNTAIRQLCVNDYQPENGKYKVPDLPGLGQEHQ